MKTVPTLVASSAGAAVSALGFALARPESLPEPDLPLPSSSRNSRSSLRRSDSAPLFDMTSTATCTLQAVDTYASPSTFSFSSPITFSHSAQKSLQSAVSREPSAGHARTDSGSRKRTLKRSVHSRDSVSMASEDKAGEENSDTSGWASSVTQSTWLKRLSTFSAIESSLPSSPRPDSAAVSQSNGSFAFSNTGSTTPMLATTTPPPPIPPNKLVKRSSSVHSTTSPLFQSSSSKLPLPTLRRPATSHQRDATLRSQRQRGSKRDSRPLSELFAPQSPDDRWTTYFVPKIAAEHSGSTWRRHSTGIPNPIKRVVPDRRYRPTLLSAREPITASGVEVDQEQDGPLPILPTRTPSQSSRRFFSSPLPARTSMSGSRIPSPPTKEQPRSRKEMHVFGFTSTEAEKDGKTDQPSTPPAGFDLSTKRSFSPTDLLPTETTKWKRTPVNGAKQPKERRTGGRVVSAPLSTMGNKQSTPAESERPAKRREVVGQPGQRRSTLAKDTSVKRPTSSPSHEVQLNLSSPTGYSPATANAVRKLSNPKRRSDENSASFPEARIHPSQTSFSSALQPSGSTAISEFASTNNDSDNDELSRDEDGLDSQSEAVYDSIRTRATSASSSVKGPSIEKIWDASRLVHSENKPTPLHDLLARGPSIKQDFAGRPRHSVIEEEESVLSTPVRSTHNESAGPSPQLRFADSDAQQSIPSSPPEMPDLWGLQLAQQDTSGHRQDDESWDFGDEQNDHTTQLSLKSRFPHLDVGPDRLSPHSFSHGCSSVTTTPQRGGLALGQDTRSSIFDWSEQQPLDKSPGNRSPPRPKTVHGKKDAENRGSRSVGRRPPSGIHARSQSVPVAQEADGKRSQVVTNKFGTWGVGSKGVTEDWNEDFDFEEPPLPVRAQETDDNRLDSGVGMVVPNSIREQQHNVLANIGLLRDWGLLIEELKDLKARAALLSLLDGKHTDMWGEVDAMVDLADQESDDHTLAPRYSPPSSPTFDYDAFDEPIIEAATTLSVPEDDVFDTISASASPSRKDAHLTPSGTPRRPRKDSEAVAKSVIEALQQKRNISDPTHCGPSSQPTKKVPFDTATLRRIVPYVQDLRDKVKRTLREAEGLYTSPQHREPSDQDPSFSRIFREPPDSPSYKRRSRRSTAATDHVHSEGSTSRSPDDLTARLKLMTVA